MEQGPYLTMNRRLPAMIRILFSPIRWLWIRLFPTHYLRMQYRFITGRHLSLTHPKTFTEKLQYYRLKLYPFDPLVIRCTDRLGLMDYLQENDLSAIQVPILGTYHRFEDIPFASLPSSFVMKCTHASGFNQIIYDKKEINLPQLKRQFNRWLKTDYGKKTLEPHYSSIPPRILIETYLGQEKSLPLEYKLHCFQGEMKYLYVVSGRGHDIRYTHFLRDWSPLPGAQFNGWQSSDYPILQPTLFPEMIAYAEKLAKPFPFVRVDMYVIHDKIYLSELTFTPAKGTLNMLDPQVDVMMGAWLP